MIPPLDSNGLLPPGEHLCSLAEAEAAFATNDRRRDLWTSLTRRLEELRSLDVAGHLVIDGSYVTDKAHPDDIEITWDVRGLSQAAQNRVICFFYRHSKRFKIHGVHFFPTIEGDSDFTLYFQYVGPKTARAKGLSCHAPKGVLRITAWQ